MANARAPKQWQLTKNETINSFENWRQNLIYILSLDVNFATFLPDDSTWLKKTAANPLRGLANDGEDVPENRRRTAEQKNVHLDLMLGQIASYCTVISRNSIIKNSTSLQDIWQKIRLHYGFQSTGANFLNFVDIKMQPDERYEDLYQRLMAFIDDNLLTTRSGITHHGEGIDQDEDLTPTLENMVVVTWLQLIHPQLPQLVKQKYGADLRNKTLASLKPEISQAIPSLIDELHSIEDTKAMRTATPLTDKYKTSTFKARQHRLCVLCKAAGRPTYNTHYLRECRYVPEADKRQMCSRSRLVGGAEDAQHDGEQYEEDIPCVDEPNPLIDQPVIGRVDVVQSPFLNTFYYEHPVRLTLDTGATTNMIRQSFAQAIQLPITAASQMARQADGVTPLDVVGEVHCKLTRNDQEFHLDALVVKQLDVDVLAGNPFHVKNDIAIRPAKKQIVIRGKIVIYYGKQGCSDATARRTQAFVLRSPPQQTTVLPGEYVEFLTPDSLDSDSSWALEPRYDSPCNIGSKIECAWPSVQEVSSVGNVIRVTNTTKEPILLKRNEHLCQIRSIATVESTIEVDIATAETTPKTSPSSAQHSESVSIDPDGILPSGFKAQFQELNKEFAGVFNPSVSKYNGSSGPLQAVVNMGPTLPPQRKGRLPHYNKEMLIELQKKFDELEEMGVFATPEQMNVTAEYLNLSFLVRKPAGGYRLVTSFAEVGQYSKPQPSLMPNVDGVLREIGKWKYIIKADLLKSFYQIPLSHNSMKYCGVVTPFKGIRVYTRCAMGMPGSEAYLEELMCRVLGTLIQEGCVAKLADDLFCGGDDPEEVLSNWRRVLCALNQNNLRLSGPKTVICPKSTTILGWRWCNGTLSASPHRIAALANTSQPTTVQGLRSFVGAYKALSRVLHGYADLLQPLDKATAGRESKEKIAWTEDLTSAFNKAKAALANNKTITIPRPTDQLCIITDASSKHHGLAGTLYACRNGQTLLSGFFNAKLKTHQIAWLPCELEALAIGSSVKHFAPYITASSETTQVLTDSRPCVQAYNKLNRGEFSASSRVTTFLATVSRFNVTVSHISGVNNIPTDYCSRHPSSCNDNSCQICRFVQENADSVIHNLSVKDVIDSGARMPFTNRAAWLATQHECPALRRTHSHLFQGTRPSKKQTDIPDVKRYLREVSIASDGLCVVRTTQPFHPVRERIVVPSSVLSGILTALHIRFNHPSMYQTKQLFNRHFFALDLDKTISAVNSSCHHCVSLKSMPAQFYPQSSSPPPASVGVTFAADVMKRYSQLVLVMRETVSSFTSTCFIESEKRDDLRNAIIMLCADTKHLGPAGAIIRVDPAPGFISLQNDPILQQYGLKLDIGSPKNVNKNPVAEKSIAELGLECLHISPEGGPISRVNLALATANMNSRIRKGGLSAREVFTQRDQITGEQLPITDRQLIMEQNLNRTFNHPHSSKSKAHGRTTPDQTMFQIGDLVFLKQEKQKTQARDKYLVIGVSDDRCQLRKFTRSQFRSKVYTVRPSDCYHVQPTMLTTSPVGPIRGMDRSLPTCNDSQPLPSSVETDDLKADTPCQEANLQEHLGSPIDTDNCELEIPTSEQETVPTDDVRPPTTDVPLRTSSRPRKAPAWQMSGEWIMD